MRTIVETGLGVVKTHLQDLRATIPAEDDTKAKEPTAEQDIKERLASIDLAAFSATDQWRILLRFLVDDHRQLMPSDKRNDRTLAAGFMREFVRIGIITERSGWYEFPQLRDVIPGLEG